MLTDQSLSVDGFTKRKMGCCELESFSVDTINNIYLCCSANRHTTKTKAGEKITDAKKEQSRFVLKPNSLSEYRFPLRFFFLYLHFFCLDFFHQQRSVCHFIRALIFMLNYFSLNNSGP